MHRNSISSLWLLSAPLFWLLSMLLLLYAPLRYPPSSTAREITVFAWGDSLVPELLQQFTKETGIKVHLQHYFSNDELLTRLRTTRGRGCDLLTPSDYAVEVLAGENLLKPLQKERLPFWSRLAPPLLGHDFDPQNRYSIPYAWEVFGLGIDRQFFARHSLQPSWEALFQRQLVDYRVGMLSDPGEAVMLTALYLFQQIDRLSDAQVEQIRDLLIAQRQRVAAYVNLWGDSLLATRCCPLVASSSSAIWRIMDRYPFVDFVIPPGAKMLSIENFCLAKGTTKEALVYQFLDFLYRKESIRQTVQELHCLPPTQEALAAIPFPGLQQLFKEPLYLYKSTMLAPKRLRDLWVAVKSSAP